MRARARSGIGQAHARGRSIDVAETTVIQEALALGRVVFALRRRDRAYANLLGYRRRRFLVAHVGLGGVQFWRAAHNRRSLRGLDGEALVFANYLGLDVPVMAAFEYRLCNLAHFDVGAFARTRGNGEYEILTLDG